MQAVAIRVYEKKIIFLGFLGKILMDVPSILPTKPCASSIHLDTKKNGSFVKKKSMG